MTELENLQQQITENKDRIVTKSLELSGRLDAFVATSQANTDLANYASDRADTALSEIYTTGILSNQYTDRRIAALRAELQEKIGIWQNQAGTDLLALLNGEITDVLSDALGRAEAAASAAEDSSVEMTAEQVAIRNAISHLLDIELAAAKAASQDAILKAETLEAELITAFEGMEFASIVAGFENLTAKFNEALRAALDGTLRLPATNWTTAPDNASISFISAPEESWFKTDDPLLGDVLAVPTNQALNIGPSYPISFDPDEIYRVTVRLRFTALPTDGQGRLRIGARTWTTDDVTQANPTVPIYSETAPLDTPITIHAYVTANSALANRVDDAPVLLLTGSDDAARARIFLNVQSQNGDVRIHQIKTEQYTPLIKLQDYSDTAFEDADRRINELTQNLDDAINGNSLKTQGNWTFQNDWSGWATTADLTKTPRDCTTVEIGQILEDTSA